MNIPTLKFLTQPACKATIAAALVGAVAALLGRRAETKVAKIPVEQSSDKTRGK